MKRSKIIILIFYIIILFLGCNDDSEKEDQQDQLQLVQNSTIIKLPANEWYPDTIGDFQTKHYYFDAIEGKLYKIWTDSLLDGSGKYDANILIAVVDENRTFEYGIFGENYSFPVYLEALKTEKIIIDVQNFSVGKDGKMCTLALKYEEY